MYDKTVTVFNKYTDQNDNIYWYPHVLRGVDLIIDKAANVAKKVVTERPLTYGNPKATPHWFDTAKDAHGKSWVKGVKRIAGGGKK